MWGGILSAGRGKARQGTAALGAGYLLLLKPFVEVLWSARWPVIVEGSAIVDGTGEGDRVIRLQRGGEDWWSR